MEEKDPIEEILDPTEDDSTSDTPDTSDTQDTSDTSGESDKSDESDTQDSPELPTIETQEYNLREVLNLCVSLADGSTTSEEIKRLMDAIEAGKEIAALAERERELQLQLQLREEEFERRLKEQAEEMKREMETKVAEAYTAGVIEGKNARIVELMQSPVVIPDLGNTPRLQPKTPSSIFDIAGQAR